MASRFLCLAGAALFTPSVGIRKQVKSSANATTLGSSSSNDCSALSDIVIDGKDYGKGFELICRVWPPNLGEFPVNDVTRARDLVEHALGPGGAYEQINQIRENRQNRGFCWRNETLRTIVEEDCEMESRGVCYGNCPVGYRPGLLSGVFGPACTTACSASTRPVSCGFGCASTVRQCARTILDQAKAVASGVGSVYSFITQDDRIPRAVDAILNFAEFLLSVVPSLIASVRGGIEIITGNEDGVMVVVLLYQYIQEVAPEFGETVESIRDAFNELGDVITDIVAGERTEGLISVGRIVRNILDHGEAALDYAVTLTKAFSFEKCRIADDVAFVVDEVGDTKFEGPYVQRGMLNNHPRYSLKSNSDLRVEWTNNYWQFAHYGWIYNTYHYQSFVRSSEYPLQGWMPLSGADPVPEIIAMRERIED